MIVTTDFVHESGQGTAMFSKNGRLTSFQYKAFADPDHVLNKMKYQDLSIKKEEEYQARDN